MSPEPHRRALVTGANRGIGRATAMFLADRGMNLCLTARNGELLEKVAHDARSRGATVHTVTADLRNAANVQELVATATGTGTVDVLVNNAGSVRQAPLLDADDDTWREAWEANFLGAVRLVRGLVPGMRERRWGRIVNLASTAAREPSVEFGPYSAAKAALVNYSKALSLRLARGGITVNCVLPGVTATDSTERLMGEAAEATGRTREGVLDVVTTRQIALGRLGQPDDIAAAIGFLVSEEAGWITGTSVVVDGGTLRHC